MAQSGETAQIEVRKEREGVEKVVMEGEGKGK